MSTTPTVASNPAPTTLGSAVHRGFDRIRGKIDHLSTDPRKRTIALALGTAALGIGFGVAVRTSGIGAGVTVTAGIVGGLIGGSRGIAEAHRENKQDNDRRKANSEHLNLRRRAKYVGHAAVKFTASGVWSAGRAVLVSETVQNGGIGWGMLATGSFGAIRGWRTAGKETGATKKSQGLRALKQGLIGAAAIGVGYGVGHGLAGIFSGESGDNFHDHTSGQDAGTNDLSQADIDDAKGSLEYNAGNGNATVTVDGQPHAITSGDFKEAGIDYSPAQQATPESWDFDNVGDDPSGLISYRPGIGGYELLQNHFGMTSGEAQTVWNAMQNDPNVAHQLESTGDFYIDGSTGQMGVNGGDFQLTADSEQKIMEIANDNGIAKNDWLGLGAQHTGAQPATEYEIKVIDDAKFQEYLNGRIDNNIAGLSPENPDGSGAGAGEALRTGVMTYGAMALAAVTMVATKNKGRIKNKAKEVANSAGDFFQKVSGNRNRVRSEASEIKMAKSLVRAFPPEESGSLVKFMKKLRKYKSQFGSDGNSKDGLIRHMQVILQQQDVAKKKQEAILNKISEKWSQAD